MLNQREVFLALGVVGKFAGKHVDDLTTADVDAVLARDDDGLAVQSFAPAEVRRLCGVAKAYFAKKT